MTTSKAAWSDDDEDGKTLQLMPASGTAVIQRSSSAGRNQATAHALVRFTLDNAAASAGSTKSEARFRLHGALPDDPHRRCIVVLQRMIWRGYRCCMPWVWKLASPERYEAVIAYLHRFLWYLHARYCYMLTTVSLDKGGYQRKKSISTRNQKEQRAQLTRSAVSRWPAEVMSGSCGKYAAYLCLLRHFLRHGLVVKKDIAESYETRKTPPLRSDAYYDQILVD
jgi:hypothetical protein